MLCFEQTTPLTLKSTQYRKRANLLPTRRLPFSTHEKNWPFRRETYWTASMSTNAFVSQYSTKTSNSFKLVLTTSRNWKQTTRGKFSYWMNVRSPTVTLSPS